MQKGMLFGIKTVVKNKTNGKEYILDSDKTSGELGKTLEKDLHEFGVSWGDRTKPVDLEICQYQYDLTDFGEIRFVEPDVYRYTISCSGGDTILAYEATVMVLNDGRVSMVFKELNTGDKADRVLFADQVKPESPNTFDGGRLPQYLAMLLGAAVTRALGADAGGIFFFAFSTFGQQMFIVSYFGMRPVQITDTAGRFTYGEYWRFRFLTAMLAMLVSLGYGLLLSEGGEARQVLLLMASYKVLDGMADCPDCEFQRQGRLYLAGKSNAFRTLVSAGGFLLCMLLYRPKPRNNWAEVWFRDAEL